MSLGKHNQPAMPKPTVTFTRNVSSPLAIGTGAAIGADAPCARIGTGGANPGPSVVHSPRPSRRSPRKSYATQHRERTPGRDKFPAFLPSPFFVLTPPGSKL